MQMSPGVGRRAGRRAVLWPDCREAFHAALHQWALGEVEAGRVNLDVLRKRTPGGINAATRGDPGVEVAALCG